MRKWFQITCHKFETHVIDSRSFFGIWPRRGDSAKKTIIALRRVGVSELYWNQCVGPTQTYITFFKVTPKIICVGFGPFWFQLLRTAVCVCFVFYMLAWWVSRIWPKCHKLNGCVCVCVTHLTRKRQFSHGMCLIIYFSALHMYRCSNTGTKDNCWAKTTTVWLWSVVRHFFVGHVACHHESDDSKNQSATNCVEKWWGVRD